MQNQVFPQQWISLPKATREHLIEVFSLNRSGVTEIRDQEVISDGYSAEDLKRISLENMRQYIGSEETFARAWEITLAKCHAELNPPIGEIRKTNGEATIVDVVETVTEVKPDGEVIETKIEGVVIPVDLVEDLKVVAAENGSALLPKEKPAIVFTPDEPKPRFCETCDSKGVRHKNYCPKYVEIRHGKE